MNEYNAKPIGWEEIGNDDFIKLFFGYIIKIAEFKQLYYDDSKQSGGTFKCRMFELKYPCCKGMGVAIANDWKSNKIVYYKYGSDEQWITFKKRYVKAGAAFQII